MKYLFFLIAAAALSPGAASLNEVPAEAPKKISVAVVDLSAEGMTKQEITALSDRLRTELFNTGKFTVMERGQMNEVMKEQGFQQSGACSEEACLVQMGQLLGVNKLVAGSLGKLGALYMINIRIINVGSGLIEKTVAEDCRCEIEGLINSLRNVAYKLANTGESAPPAPSASRAPATPAPAPPTRQSPPAAPANPQAYGNKPALRFTIGSAGMDNAQFNDMYDYLSQYPDYYAAPEDWSRIANFGVSFKTPLGKIFGLRLNAGMLRSTTDYTYLNSDASSDTTAVREYALSVFPMETGLLVGFGERFRVSAGFDVGFCLAMLNYTFKRDASGYDSTFTYVNEHYEESVPYRSSAIVFKYHLDAEFFLTPRLSIGSEMYFTNLTLTDFEGDLSVDEDPSNLFFYNGEKAVLSNIEYADGSSVEPELDTYKTLGATPAEIDLQGLGFLFFLSINF